MQRFALGRRGEVSESCNFQGLALKQELRGRHRQT